MAKISIVIPTYEYKGSGVECLDYSLRILQKQTFKDFDVVISDHSKDDGIFHLVKTLFDDLDIKYFRNTTNRGNSASNFNFGMEKATGEWIKLLCQDDYLYDKNSLALINNSLNYRDDWLVTDYWHTNDRNLVFNYHHASFNMDLYIVNTIGTPSCIAIRNRKPVQKFDENLSYAYDCEYYWRFWIKYGDPIFLNYPTIVNYLWDKSISSDVSQALINKENRYIIQKLFGEREKGKKE